MFHAFAIPFFQFKYENNNTQPQISNNPNFPSFQKAVLEWWIVW